LFRAPTLQAREARNKNYQGAEVAN